MLKRLTVFLLFSGVMLVKSQDFSTLRNTMGVYSDNLGLVGNARYTAMAGAMGALGGDMSSVNTNPAGLGLFITGDFQATLSFEEYKNSTLLFGANLPYRHDGVAFAQVGSVLSFRRDGDSEWKFVNFSINYTTKSVEDYVESPGDVGIGHPAIPGFVYSGHAYDRDGSMGKLNVALGGNYQNRLYVGGSLNFHDANLRQSDTFRYKNEAGESLEFGKQYTPFEESSHGVSLSFGMIGKVSEYFRLGAAIETPTWWNINRNYREYESPLSRSIVPYEIYIEDRSLTSPMRLSLSSALVFLKDFVIDVDYSIGVSNPQYKVQGDAERELNKFFDDHYEKPWELRLGAEYRFDDFRLRGGYSFLSNPFNSVTLPIIVPGSGYTDASYKDFLLSSQETWSLGLGYDFKIFYADIVYQNMKSDYSNPFYRGSYFNSSGNAERDFIYNEESIVSDVKSARSRVSLSIGWKF